MFCAVVQSHLTGRSCHRDVYGGYIGIVVEIHTFCSHEASVRGGKPKDIYFRHVVKAPSPCCIEGLGFLDILVVTPRTPSVGNLHVSLGPKGTLLLFDRTHCTSDIVCWTDLDLRLLLKKAVFRCWALAARPTRNG